MTTDYAYLPKDKADLLERIQREWTALMTMVERLNAEQISHRDAGGWSIKDNLAHLTEWERFLMRNQFKGQAAHIAMDLDQAALEKLDEAGINAVLLERNRNRPLAEVLSHLHQTHQQLLEALEKLPAEDLQQMGRSIGPETGPLVQWVVFNTYEHYAEHRRTIQANLALKSQEQVK